MVSGAQEGVVRNEAAEGRSNRHRMKYVAGMGKLKNCIAMRVVVVGHQY